MDDKPPPGSTGVAAFALLRSEAGGPVWAFLAAGLSLLIVCLLWLALSHRPVGQDILGVNPIVWLVLIGMAGGAVLVALPWALRRVGNGAGLLFAMIGLGLVMRLILLPSVPMLENDYNRYLWDGAVVGLGVNPYAHAPAEVRAAAGVPDALVALAAESQGLIERIGHPELRTIYPPLAQAAFALAHQIAPWDLTAWRVLLLAFEAASLVLLLALLRDLGLSPLWAALYWWNPLVVKEFVNSAHMDALLIPFLLGTLLLALRGRTLGAAGVLALASGVKVWPVLLLPLVLRPVFGKAKELLAAAGLFAGIVTVLALPVVLTGLDRQAGVVAYAATWERNDALFMAIAWALDQALMAFDLTAYDAKRIARALVALALAALAVGLNLRLARDRAEICRRAVILIAALFLLSPAQYPWYYAWLVPFLALVPSPALLLLTAMLPLYYLRFHFEALGMVAAFDHYVVWLEYLPVLLLLLWAFASRPIPGLRPAAPIAHGPAP